MSKPSTQPPDFDEEFTKAVAEWRDKHRLREDDAVILLVELFRIHQRHWDELRRREMPVLRAISRGHHASSSARRRHFNNIISFAGTAAKPATGSPCRENHPRRRNSSPRSPRCWPVISSGGHGNETRPHPFGPIMPPPDFILALRYPQYYFAIGGILLAAHRNLALVLPRKGNGCVARLGGLTWKRNQFCRGWLITGDTGSGKTSSGINQLAHQVFQNEPKWGGLCVDEKGVYWETLAAMATSLWARTRPDSSANPRQFNTDAQWQPPHRYNLTGDRSIPFIHLCQVRRGYRHESGSGRRQGLFQKPGTDPHCARARNAL
jgi:hypothetical protein